LKKIKKDLCLFVAFGLELVEYRYYCWFDFSKKKKK